MPRNSRDVDGPTDFSGERGSQRCLNAEERVQRPYAGGKERGDHHEEVNEEVEHIG